MDSFLTLLLLLTINNAHKAIAVRQVFPHPGSKVITVGDTIDFYCNFEKNDYNLTWTRLEHQSVGTVLAEGENVKVNDTRVSVTLVTSRAYMDRYTLTIKDVNTTDSGKYQCLSAKQLVKHKVFKLQVEEPSINEAIDTIEAVESKVNETSAMDEKRLEEERLVKAAGIKAIRMTIEILKSIVNNSKLN